VLAANAGAPGSPPLGHRPLYHHLLTHYETLAMLGGRSFEIRTSGEEHLREALARADHTGAGGLILATVHAGNWTLGGLLIHERTGRSIHTIAGTQITRGWTGELRRLCRARGIRIHSKRGSTPRLLRVLRAGGVVALHLDGDQHARSGIATRGASLLSRRSGAPILPGVCERVAPGVFVARFWPPFDGGEAAPSPARLEETILALVRGRADQWALFRPLWGRAA